MLFRIQTDPHTFRSLKRSIALIIRLSLSPQVAELFNSARQNRIKEVSINLYHQLAIMARAKETSGKKEVRSKQEKKRKEKERKRIERKESRSSGESSSMIAYVDEFGNITSTPPDPATRQVIKAEDINISVPNNTDPGSNNPIRTGIVTFFDAKKGFGFIRDTETSQDYFVHVNGLLEPISENNKVVYKLVRGQKGMNAVDVQIKRE